MDGKAEAIATRWVWEMADLPAQCHSRFTLFLARTLVLILERCSRPLSLACDTRSSLAGPHTLRKPSRGTAKVQWACGLWQFACSLLSLPSGIHPEGSNATSAERVPKSDLRAVAGQLSVRQVALSSWSAMSGHGSGSSSGSGSGW